MKPVAVRIAALVMVGLPALTACSSGAASTQSPAAPTPAAAAAPSAAPSPSDAPTGPDAACQVALQQQFDAGVAATDAGQPAATPVDPPACKGVAKSKIDSWNSAMAQAWIQQHLTTANN